MPARRARIEIIAHIAMTHNDHDAGGHKIRPYINDRTTPTMCIIAARARSAKPVSIVYPVSRPMAETPDTQKKKYLAAAGV